MIWMQTDALHGFKNWVLFNLMIIKSCARYEQACIGHVSRKAEANPIKCVAMVLICSSHNSWCNLRWANERMRIQTCLVGSSCRLLLMGKVPPYSSSCSSRSQIAASKGKGVVQPPADVVIILAHSFSASILASWRCEDLQKTLSSVSKVPNIYLDVNKGHKLRSLHRMAHCRANRLQGKWKAQKTWYKSRPGPLFGLPDVCKTILISRSTCHLQLVHRSSCTWAERHQGVIGRFASGVQSSEHNVGLGWFAAQSPSGCVQDYMGPLFAHHIDLHPPELHKFVRLDLQERRLCKLLPLWCLQQILGQSILLIEDKSCKTLWVSRTGLWSIARSMIEIAAGYLKKTCLNSKEQFVERRSFQNWMNAPGARSSRSIGYLSRIAVNCFYLPSAVASLQIWFASAESHSQLLSAPNKSMNVAEACTIVSSMNRFGRIVPSWLVWNVPSLIWLCLIQLHQQNPCTHYLQHLIFKAHKQHWA